MKTTKKDLGSKTYEFEITIDKKDVQAKYNRAFEELRKELKAPGFRKGKAPKDIAEKHIPKEQIYKRAINILIPDIYKTLLKEESLKPITSPKVELIKAEEGKDWVVRITVCEKPDIDVSAVKDKIRKLNSEYKKADIWVPGKSKKEKSDKEKGLEKQKHLNKIFNELIKTAKVDIPHLLIEEELNRRLARLVDDVQKAGLSMESYLKSKNETIDSIKKRFQTEIEEMYKLEFILEKVADDNKITVEQKDLNALFANIKDEKAKKQAAENAYFYASILKRQKTLDYLLSL